MHYLEKKEREITRGVTYDLDPEQKCEQTSELTKEKNADGSNELLLNTKDETQRGIIYVEKGWGSNQDRQRTKLNSGMKVEVVCSESENKGDSLLQKKESNLKKGVTYDEDENECVQVSRESEGTRGLKAKLIKGKNECPPKLVATHISGGSNYSVSLSKEILSRENIKFSAGLNFHLFPQGKAWKIMDTDAGEKALLFYYIEIAVFLLNGGIQSFYAEVQSDRIRGNNWLSKFSHSYAMLPETKPEKRAFRMMVQKCIEDDEKVTELIYHRNGWRQIPEIGWGFVYSKGVIGKNLEHVRTVDDSYELCVSKETLGTKLNFDNAMKVFQLCKKPAASVGLFLYTIASLMETLFKECGYPIKFVFGICGITNSRKTSMAVAIAKVFNRKELKADAEFSTATAGGIEKTMGKYKDGVAIIDDLKPGVNRTQHIELEKKIDKLVRFYGDRVDGKRMVPPPGVDNQTNYFPVSGGCVVTMEIPPTVDSTLTRMYLVEIEKDDVQNSVLSYFQTNLEVLPNFYYDFLSWITGNMDNVLAYIPKQFVYERNEHKFAVERHSEMYALFMIVSQLIAMYAISRGFWNNQQAEGFDQMVSNIISEQLCIMGTKMNKRDKSMVIVEAIIEGLQCGEIVPIQLTRDSCQLCSDCYEDDEMFYIRSGCLLSAIRTYSERMGEKIVINGADELISVLERQGLLDVKGLANGRCEKSRKLPEQRGNHQRYLYIKKYELQNLINYY